MRLRGENLACSRGERRIFEGVSFALGPGDALVVVGRNGAGKSSLLDILAGRLAPAGGALVLTEADDGVLTECLHYVGHRDALKAALTAEENLTFARDFLGSPALKPREALAVLGLAHAAGLPVAYLSAGQRRRVALARLLVARRPLWLLDEPTAALDTASQDILHRLIADHRHQGGIVIATTHQPLGLTDAKTLRIERPALSDSAGLAPAEGETA
ncbi:heme ABC exporter ATP-binding protein CcmA [Microvirga rosea]|uniref:heme ABC exporter ATP-binding protein CcmA n=1 Tax=Microvirga rosea TaxID=2715425 RepID=UPI001D0AA780|nr:heme ABC exporter ATP-binding protein CcmA [Microvirga rosea]MCB8819156.1 heme ABC exporter ATP-binding protein CcmA [Microvirga rosea]